MDFKSRLKSNPIFNNWKFILAYFVGAAALSVLIRFTDTVLADYRAGVVAAGVITVFYTFIAAFYMLSVNYTINNHRHTVWLYAYILAVFFAVLAVIITVDMRMYYLAAALAPIYILIMFIIYARTSKKEGARISFFAYAACSVSVCALLYLIISSILSSFAGITLAVPAAGAAVAIVFTVAGAVSLKNKKPVDTGELKKRFDAHLDAVFSGVPFTEENLALREGLYEKLNVYAENAAGGGKSENKIYREAVDALGDYSSEIRKYKKNPLTRLSKTSNLFADAWAVLVAQFTIIIFGISGVSDGKWNEKIAMLIMIPLAGLFVLLLLRVVNNFRFRQHKLTAIFIGLPAAFGLLLALFTISNEDGDPKVMKALIVSITTILIVSTVSEIVYRKLSGKKKKGKIA